MSLHLILNLDALNWWSTIDTGDHAPIHQQPYLTPVVRCQQMDEMVATMQQQGIIETSSSPWASPVVLVPKDQSLRFCIDYRIGD